MQASQAKFTRNSWCFDLIFLTFGIILVFGLYLGSRPLSVPDEARYAEIPREMLITKDFVTPHLDGVKYFEKPPLFYWVQASAIQFLNPMIKSIQDAFSKPGWQAPISEWAVRIPNAVLAWIGCLWVYVAGRLIFERRAGILSAIILATSLLYFALARMVTLDMALSVFLEGSFISFLIAMNTLSRFQRALWLYGVYIFSALAVLTKGLVGILFPILIIGCWMVMTKQWFLLKRIHLFRGILLFLLITLPWHSLVQLRNPEFFYFYFIEQQFLRYTTLIAGRYEPIWFFVPIFIIGFLPWIYFVLHAVGRFFSGCEISMKNKNNVLFLLIWGGLIFIFFSLSNSKLIPYILPMFPALAILTGYYLTVYWRSPTLKWDYILGFFTWILLGAVGILWWFMDKRTELSFMSRALLIGGYSILLLSSALASFFSIRRRPYKAFVLLAAGSVLGFLVVSLNISKLDTRSVKPLMKILRPLLSPQTKVVAYHNYYQDLPFYLNRKVLLVGVGGELSFGLHQQSHSKWNLKETDLWTLWAEKPRVYILTNKEIYKELKQHNTLIYLLGSTDQDVLLSNTDRKANEPSNGS